MHFYGRHVAIFFILMAALSAGTALAWTGPSASPPNNNVSAPLNVGSSAQTKSGALTVTGTGGVTSPQYCIGASCISSWPSGGSGGQWSTSANGSSIYYSSGYVGVGTNAPAYPFEVTSAGNTAHVISTGTTAAYNGLTVQTTYAGAQALLAQNLGSGNYCYLGGGSGSAAGNYALYCSGPGIVSTASNSMFGLEGIDSSGTSAGLGTNGGVVGYTHVGGSTSVGVEGYADNGGWGGLFAATSGGALYAYNGSNYYTQLDNTSWGVITNGNIQAPNYYNSNGQSIFTYDNGTQYSAQGSCTGGVLTNCNSYLTCNQGGFLVQYHLYITGASGAVVYGYIDGECEL